MSASEETTTEPRSTMADAVAEYEEAAAGDSNDAEHDAANGLAHEIEALMAEHPTTVMYMPEDGGNPVAVFADRAGWLTFDWGRGAPRLTRHDSEASARKAAADLQRPPHADDTGHARRVVIQPKALPDLTVPYPYWIDEDGSVGRQDFWQGTVTTLVGFQADATVQKVDLLCEVFLADPVKAIGMFPVFIGSELGKPNAGPSMFTLTNPIDTIQVVNEPRAN